MSDKPEANVDAADAATALSGEPVEAPATGTQEQEGPDLTVQDLQALKSIIDVASQRGAFRPNEMMTVGQTYNKLFLNLLSIFDSCSDSFLNYLKKNRRNLAYDIGRIASDYQLSTELGICALSFYEERHILPDSIPLPWVYYHIAKLEKMKGDISRMEIFISKVKPYKNDYPSISSLINQLIQQ